MRRTTPGGFSLIGMLVTMACIAVLSVVLLSALNKAMTGEGSALKNTARSMQDEVQLYAVTQSLIVGANDYRGQYLTPALLAGEDDPRLNTTAALFSAIVMQNYTTPEQLIAGNEYSGYVEMDEDYDFLLYDPGAGVYWDPAFAADLHNLSNVSYAHMPLYGERLRKFWKATYHTRFPVIGNRGPKDGIDDPESMTYGRNGLWAGHVAFGDGHIEFIDTFTPGNISYDGPGGPQTDNIFAMETGPEGEDAILSFTKEMKPDGPVLQHD